MKKLFEFCGSPEMLIALLYSDDVCQTIKDEVRASRKVTLFMFAEEEPYYTPDSDDIQVTMTGEDIRPKVDPGEPVQVEDDLHWDEHHEARIDQIGQNGGDGLHYNDPEYQKEIQRYRNSKHTEMHLRETRAHEWMEGDDEEVVGV